MSKDFTITSHGLEKLKAEFHDLKEVRLKEIAQKLKEARELGDLSENAEYEEAKNEQAFVSGRVQELERSADLDEAADDLHRVHPVAALRHLRKQAGGQGEQKEREGQDRRERG